MELKIKEIQTDDERIGFVSKETFDEIPADRKPQLCNGKYFHMGWPGGSLIVTVEVKDDNSLEKGVLFLHQKAKKYSYKDAQTIAL